MRIETTKAVTAIGQVLQEQLDHGLLAPGSKLPAERKLSELFGTTRITVREALLQLEAQGQIYREERRGWFVSPPRLAYNLMQRSHFHAMVSAQGRVPSTEVISARLQPASAAVCAWLQLPALSSVIQICRARRIDERLVLYVEHYLNPQFFPGILEFRFESVDYRAVCAALRFALRAGAFRDCADGVVGGCGGGFTGVGGESGVAHRSGQLRSA